MDRIREAMAKIPAHLRATAACGAALLPTGMSDQLINQRSSCMPGHHH